MKTIDTVTHIEKSNKESIEKLMNEYKRNGIMILLKSGGKLISVYNNLKTEDGIVWYTDFCTGDEVGIPLYNINLIQIMRRK